MNTTLMNGDEQSVRLQICRRASELYRQADRFAYHFAYFKLKADPLFTDILTSGALRDCRNLVDLGCGQGLLTAWLDAAHRQHAEGPWPAHWPQPPQIQRTRGVDLRIASIQRAKAALGHRGEFRVLDIRRADCSAADAVAILDVVHYIPFDEQQRVLEQVRAALPPGGALVMRVANAGSGFQYKLARWIDQVNDLARDGRFAPAFCRSVDQWLALLRSCRFEAKAQENSAGRSFSNTVLIARAA